MLRDPDPVLMDALVALRVEFEAGISEFLLLQRLKQSPWNLFVQVNLSDSLDLFRCHFTLFNALYTLSDQWLSTEQRSLDIHTLCIRLVSVVASDKEYGLAAHNKLRHYYLDWSNFTTTKGADVDALINSFWQRLQIGDDNTPGVSDARECLGLLPQESFTTESLKKRYRRLMLNCHPDKGGSHSNAQKVITAYRVLRATLD